LIDPKPYRATPDELRAIDEALAQQPIPETELPAYYRREAARLRAEANQAETVEMRIALLEAAERADKLAIFQYSSSGSGLGASSPGSGR
jgi:hypothetical protein